MVLIVFFNERGSVFGGNLLPQKYSPPQRSLDAYGMRFAGARHGHHKTAYKLNSLGLPEKVMLYSKQLEIPSDISVEIIDNEHIYDEEYGNVNMAYDESGTRIWERTYTRGGYKGSNVTIPGIGIYSKENLAGDFKLTHLDLVGGGFRKGLAEEAIYPMVDAQGNVRAYASASGIKSAYDYRPFGRVEELEEYGVADDRRWQGKEYDGQHGKYYFGARYFDPFFGMWMSPDPAGQFANPYTYGGDPINFVDPTGLFALDLGFASIGWDSKRGWNFSLSSPIMSYTWNQNGSKTYEASVGGSYQWWIVSLGAEMGYSYNTYSGHSLSTGGHVCVGVKKGEAGVCAGVEAGGSLYWDPYGNYLGATAYAGAFAQAQTSDNSSVAKLNGGYETGLMGMEGRGLYAGGNLNAGVSLYASWAENGGWNYGGQESIYAGIGDNFGDVSANGKQKNVGYEMWIPTLGKYGRFNLGGNYDVSKQGMKNAQTEALLKYAKETKNEALAAFIQKNGIELNNKMFNELQRIVNIKTLSFPYDLSGTYDKAVVLTKSNDYPHIEFKYNQITFPEGKSSTFSSYNYGNNIFSHLAIDFIGYYMSRSVYNVSD
jgi:RHS repeat-associated protein